MVAPMRLKLDKSESAIERSAASFRPMTGRRLKKLESILARTRKNRNINIRISEEILAELKRRSDREGLPYQTLISSILHKYVTNRLVDQELIAKSVELLRSAR